MQLNKSLNINSSGNFNKIIDMSGNINDFKSEKDMAFILGEAIRLVELCIIAYPNCDKFQNAEMIRDTVNLWADFFKDDDWRVVATAVKRHILTSKWVPTIAEIREIVTEITHPELIHPAKAWELVSRYLQIKNSWAEEDGIFPQIISETIKAIGYKTLKNLHNEPLDRFKNGGKSGFDRVTFMQIYEEKYERFRKEAAFSPNRFYFANSPTLEECEKNIAELEIECEERSRRREAEYYEDLMCKCEEINRINALIESGEHCGNCEFCSIKTKKLSNSRTGEILSEKEILFCENSQSEYFCNKGLNKSETSRKKRCDLFKYKLSFI